MRREMSNKSEHITSGINHRIHHLRLEENGCTAKPCKGLLSESSLVKGLLRHRNEELLLRELRKVCHIASEGKILLQCEYDQN